MEPSYSFLDRLLIIKLKKGTFNSFFSDKVLLIQFEYEGNTY